MKDDSSEDQYFCPICCKRMWIKGKQRVKEGEDVRKHRHDKCIRDDKDSKLELVGSFMRLLVPGTIWGATLVLTGINLMKI